MSNLDILKNKYDIDCEIFNFIEDTINFIKTFDSTLYTLELKIDNVTKELTISTNNFCDKRFSNKIYLGNYKFDDSKINYEIKKVRATIYSKVWNLTNNYFNIIFSNMLEDSK